MNFQSTSKSTSRNCKPDPDSDEYQICTNKTTTIRVDQNGNKTEEIEENQERVKINSFFQQQDMRDFNQIPQFIDQFSGIIPSIQNIFNPFQNQTQNQNIDQGQVSCEQDKNDENYMICKFEKSNTQVKILSKNLVQFLSEINQQQQRRHPASSFFDFFDDIRNLDQNQFFENSNQQKQQKKWRSDE